MVKLIIKMLLLVTLLGMGTVQATPELEDVTLQLKWQHQFQFAGYYAAVEQGYYADEGLAVTIRELKQHDNVIYQTLSGKANYSIGGAGVLAYYARGAPIKALTAILQHDALVFVSKQSSGIVSPYEMVGKRLMFDNKAGDNAPLIALLADAGISSDDYTHVERQFGVDALVNDKTDVMSAYITNQPYQLKALGQKINIINPQSYGFDFYGDILYTSDAEITNHPGRAERFRRASLKGWQYALEHPEQIIQLLKNKYKAQDSIEALRYEAKEMRKLILPERIVLGTIEPARLRRLADLYTQLGLAEPLTDQKLAQFVFNPATDSLFTASEQAWLNKHPTIRLGIDRDFAPYEWIDNDGNYLGLAADYMRLIEQHLGVKFDIIQDKPWHEITEMAKRGELDMLSCLSHSAEREDYLFFSPAYVSNPIVIVNDNRSGYIGSLENLTGKTVAIEQGYVTHEHLASNHPDINLLVVGSTQEALEKVTVGEADAYVGDANYANYAIKQADLLNLQFAGQTDDVNAYRLGVHKSHPELASIINKVLANISDKEHEAIKSQWLGLKITKGVEAETIVQAIALLGLIALVTSYWIYRLRESKEAIRQSELRMRSIIEASPIPHAIYEDTGKIIYLNQAFNSTFGYQLADIPTLDVWWPKAYPDPEYRSWVSTTWQHRLTKVKTAQDAVEPLEVEIRCKDGDNRQIIASAATVFSTKENNLHIVNLFDITDRKRAEEKLYLSGRVFNEAHEGIMITDANEIIIDVNPAFKEITGYEPEEVIGQHVSLLRSEKYKPEFYQSIRDELDKQGYWQGEIWSQKRNGNLYAELLTISTLLDDDGNITNYLSLFSDITENKRQQKELQTMAHYDVLTQLPNRTLFADRFGQAIAHSNRDNTLLAVVFLDLDDFKPVNDTLGHNVGDKLLVQVAQRIKDSIRDGDTASRLGGDEFALLFNDVQSTEHCQQMTERVLQAIAEPYSLDGEVIAISASAGITLYPYDNADPDTLLRHADQAMYQAKLIGRNRLHIFDAMQDQKISRRHDELQAIAAAWRADQFCLFYQPKVNMRTGEVIGAEALIRWDHPQKGIIPPMAFLPVLEGSELEIKLGNWVIEQALAQLAQWHQQGMKFELSINIASHHLLWPGFIKHLDKVLAKYPQVSSQCLQIEILESSILSDINEISTILESCRKLLGIRIALDDFGTGYSSLTHLRHFPVDVVKVDKSFIRDLLDDRDDYTIVDGVIGLTQAFHCEVIAEGVETTEHGLMLLLMDCDYAQGYGIAFPMRADDFTIWFDDHKPNPAWLAYHAMSLDKQQKLIKLFELESEHWLTKLVKNIELEQGKEHNWPVTIYKKSLYALWSEQVRLRGVFDQNWLNDLDQAYINLYQKSADLKHYYLLGESELARKGIADLYDYRDELDNLMRKYS